MLSQDVRDEEGAITMYKKTIAIAEKENDAVTKTLFERILSDEENHHDTFTSLLEEE